MEYYGGGCGDSSVVEMADVDLGCDQALIPALPDDISIQCLLKVPVQAHVNLLAVSRKWRDLVKSPDFYENRKKEGTTGYCVCMLQAIPESEAPLSSVSPRSQPMFGVSVYNVQQQLWERLPTIPEFPEGLPHFCRFVAVAGKLVVLGGWDPTTLETLRSVHVYHFSTRTWHNCADMPSCRSFFSCGASGNYVFVAGGHDNDKIALKSAEVYNIESNTWQSLPDMWEERDECGGAVLEGKFIVLSGYPTDAQGDFVSSGEIYDSTRNIWTRRENMWSMGSGIAGPGTLVVSTGQLFAFRDQQLFCYSMSKNKWELTGSIPEGESGEITPVCAAGVGDSIIITGPGNNPEHFYKTMVCKPQPQTPITGTPSCKSEWNIVEADNRYLGVTQLSCAVEI